MTRLILGILLWSAVHFVPALAADLKRNMVGRYGENAYKGVFGLFMVVAVYLIISGWTSLTPVPPEVLPVIYIAPAWGGVAAGVLVLLGFILFLAPYPPNNIKRLLRHPQLTGIMTWGVGHLLAIGTLRSIILFGGLALWAMFEMLLINSRDGKWIKPEPAGRMNDLALVLFSALVYGTFLYTHHLLFGGDPLT